MAGDWLKFDKTTPDKPEVFEIATMLGLDPDAVVGKLIRVWSWFDSHTENGNASRVTPALLDRCAGHAGFVESMVSVGWMIVENGGCSLPKFDRHCGSTAKGRALGAKRSAGFRGRNADIVTDALPREEKRREENKEQKQKTFVLSDEPSKQAKSFIPYQEILDGFGDLLPGLAQPRVLNGKRKRLIKAVWESLPEPHRRVGLFKAVFAECANDPWLNGTGPYGDAHANWRPTLDFIMREDQFTKVYERLAARKRAEKGVNGHAAN